MGKEQYNIVKLPRNTRRFAAESQEMVVHVFLLSGRFKRLVTEGGHSYLLASACLARGDQPNFEENAPRIWAEILASNRFRELLRELLRE